MKKSFIKVESKPFDKAEKIKELLKTRVKGLFHRDPRSEISDPALNKLVEDVMEIK